MDQKLISWARAVNARAVKARAVKARAVKARAVKAGAVKAGAVKAHTVNGRGRLANGVAAARQPLPPLWLFSDKDRLPDPAAVLQRLPKGLCGLVLRTGGSMLPTAMRRTLAICRDRRFPVVVAGASQHRRLASLVGRHFSGAEPINRHAIGLATASAHNAQQLRRALRGGVDCVFLSPAFETASHPGSGALGPLRWSALATRSRVPVMALGGITGCSIRRLAVNACCGAGAIGAMAVAPVTRRPQCSANAMPRP